MNPNDFKKLVRSYSADDIISDEPHVTLRCNENNIALEDIKKTILDQDADLVRVVRDRAQVYKIYYKLTRHRELKIVLDLLTHKRINIRTVRILDDRFRIGKIQRQRF